MANWFGKRERSWSIRTRIYPEISLDIYFAFSDKNTLMCYYYSYNFLNLEGLPGY